MPKKIENIKPLEEGEEFVSIDEAIEQIDKYQPTPEKVEDEKQEVEKELTSKISTYNFLIEELHEGDKAVKTQDHWIEYWNNIKDGRIFPSMSDLYLAFKELKEISEYGAPENQKQATELVDSLRSDFGSKIKNNYFSLLTSTKIIYKPRKWMVKKSLDAKIIHRYGSHDKIHMPTLKVPFYDEFDRIPVLMRNEECVAFLKALFNTEDGIETIMQTMEFISGVPRDYIVLNTPPLEKQDRHYSRSKRSKRSAYLKYKSECFHIHCDGNEGYSNLSRAVRPKNQND